MSQFIGQQAPDFTATAVMPDNSVKDGIQTQRTTAASTS
jgi:hypothetical protein